MLVFKNTYNYNYNVTKTFTEIWWRQWHQGIFTNAANISTESDASMSTIKMLVFKNTYNYNYNVTKTCTEIWWLFQHGTQRQWHQGNFHKRSKHNYRVWCINVNNRNAYSRYSHNFDDQCNMASNHHFYHYRNKRRVSLMLSPEQCSTYWL